MGGVGRNVWAEWVGMCGFQVGRNVWAEWVGMCGWSGCDRMHDSKA